MSGVGKFSLYNSGDIIKYDNLRYNVAIGDIKTNIYTRLLVNSQTSGDDNSFLWVAGLFGGTNNDLNKIALGTTNSNAVIGALDNNYNFTDLYLNSDSYTYGNIYILGKTISSNNFDIYSSVGIGNKSISSVPLNVDSCYFNNNIAFFGNSFITSNKIIFKIVNNLFPMIGATDSNNNISPLYINSDNSGNNGDVVINKLITNNLNIGFNGTNNGINIYGYGFFNSNVGIGGVLPTSTEILKIASGNTLFNNNSTIHVGNSGINNGINIYGYGFFNSNVGIGVFPTSTEILKINSGKTIFNSIADITIGNNFNNSNILKVNGNVNIVGNIGIGTNFDLNSVHIVGSTLIEGDLTASYISGDGSLITNLNPMRLSTDVPNVISGSLLKYDSIYFNVINDQLTINPDSIATSGGGVSSGTINASNIKLGKMSAVHLNYDSNFTIASDGYSLSLSSNINISGGGISGNNYVGSNYFLNVNGIITFNSSNNNDMLNISYINSNIISVNTFNTIINNNTSIKNNLGVNGNYSSNYELFVNGNIAATINIGVTSDERLKTNISNIENSLEKIKKCRGVYFNRIENEQRYIGVIAQEIEKILPEVVMTNDDGYKIVLYQNIVGILIEAIKEVDSKYNSLEDRIILLEKKYK